MRSLSFKALKSVDGRFVFVVFCLMVISLLVISSNDTFYASSDEGWLTPRVASQLRWFGIGSLVFCFFVALDYNVLRSWSWILYLLALILLVGLFFTEGRKSVQRWYRIPGLGLPLQPSELAKLILVITLSAFLEYRRQIANGWGTGFLAGLIVFIPFVLIYKQPDLGTALLLYPMSMAIFYFGNIKPVIIKVMGVLGLFVLFVVFLFFSGLVSHEKARPYVTKVLKEYQYERLNPHTHHQKASQTAIGVGGLMGSGWKQSLYTRRGWLPEPQTDSVFSAFGEEFGFVGMMVLLALYFGLIALGFQVTAVARDRFGRLLAAGITVYLAMHIIVNIGMMCGLIPITGVPLIIVSYGGSSVMVTMAALGILQSIYSRRYNFL